MLFFSERRLAEQLHSGAVTERQQFYYFLIVYAALAILGSKLVVSAIAVLIFTANIVILCYAFLINSKGDGHAFIARFICLSVPIGIKSGILFVVIGLLFFSIKFQALIHNHPDWMSELSKPELSDQQRVELAFGFSPSTVIIGFILLVNLFWAWRVKIAFEIASGQTELPLP